MPPIDLAKAKAAVRHPYTQVDMFGRVELDPNLIIKYVSERGVPKAKDPVKHIRDTLEADPQLIQSLFTADVKKWPAITDDLLKARLRTAKTKKYSERPSPCFSAADYCHVKMRGNDGNMYVSTVTNGYKSKKEEQAAFMNGTWKKPVCVWRIA